MSKKGKNKGKIAKTMRKMIKIMKNNGNNLYFIFLLFSISFSLFLKNNKKP
jgi:hypothetical protein